MLFNISPQNAEKAKRAFTTARPAHVHGYTASAILTPKNPRMIFSYQIDQIHDIIVCTIRHQEAETVEAVITARAFTDNSIEIERAELYRNASNYPYRTETSDRYMRKYDQIACIIHGAISAGLLFDVSEKPQETTGATTAKDTTCTDREPQRATEDAQTESRHKYGMRLRGYSIGSQPAGVVERADDPTGLYYDIITYNRELTPEELDMYSLTPLNAPTSTENAPQEPETNKAEHVPTAAQTEPPRATERAAESVSQSDRRTHPAAPQSHGTTKGIQRHHRPHKTAYRAIQRAGRNTSRGSPDRRKITFSAWMYKTGSDPPKILGYPIFDRFSGPNLVRNFRGVYGRYDRGDFKINALFSVEKKFFKK